MGGDATFKGTDHQAAVVAYVYVRILEGRRLEMDRRTGARSVSTERGRGAAIFIVPGAPP
jgi:hypothetical protein